MSDDSFIREVEEELRSDRLQNFWKRFGPFIIGGAIAIVIATAAYRGYEYYVDSRASASGDRFLAALNLAREGKSDEALTALQSLENDGYGAYPVLARMRAATVLQDKGDVDGAVAAFDAVAADRSAPEAIRDMARLRAAYILVDTGTPPMSPRASSRWRPTPIRCATPRARRSGWRPGRNSARRRAVLFEQIVDDAEAPRNVRAARLDHARPDPRLRQGLPKGEFHRRHRRPAQCRQVDAFQPACRTQAGAGRRHAGRDARPRACMPRSSTISSSMSSTPPASKTAARGDAAGPHARADRASPSTRPTSSLFVIDAKSGLTPDDEHLRRNRAQVAASRWCWSPTRPKRKGSEAGMLRSLGASASASRARISAEHGQGMPDLRDAIVDAARRGTRCLVTTRKTKLTAVRRSA